ncbi:MAG TPA: hypothetical protein VHZ03_24665 [Trebonia sp.]|jgi:hypothetical protein|nr:hypothetical protein [Trebonia sp.]
MDARQAYDFYKDPENQEPTGPGQRRVGRRLSSTMPIRFSREMIDAVKHFADQDGMTVGAWVRRVVDKELQRRRPPVTTVVSDQLPPVTFDYSSPSLSGPESRNSGQLDEAVEHLVLC